VTAYRVLVAETVVYQVPVEADSEANARVQAIRVVIEASGARHLLYVADRTAEVIEIRH